MATRRGARTLAPDSGWLDSLCGDIEDRTGYVVTDRAIADDLSFRDWVNALAADGLKVDDHPFDLTNRAALNFIYDLIPTTAAAAFGKTVVVRKAAQMGLTVWEMLAQLYMGLKWAPLKAGMYVPDGTLAGYKSSERFMPIMRTVPVAYDRLREENRLRGNSRGEGNVLTRVMGASRFLFLWTTGKVSTESYPFDVVSFDEVQEMLVADMEKVRERMSGSFIKFCLMLSTAKWPDSDIDYWYKLGTQHRFHTDCACAQGVVLDEVFPRCLYFNDAGRYPNAPADEYLYVCPTCQTWIQDTQRPAPVGTDGWLAQFPECFITSVHIAQTLSPTISPREMFEAFGNATDLQNFYNRKLGRPYADPSQIPINQAVLNACVAAGKAAGVEWKTRAADTFMGIDQMGAFNVVIIKERLPDGRQAVIHVEAIYDADPFQRCDALMALYGTVVCCVEMLPNYNDAKRFAGRHRGRVFLASYADIKDEMLRWGDAIETRTDRKTARAERDRYTVSLDQYKCMHVAMQRIVNVQCLFPDPKALAQVVKDKGVARRLPILQDMVFHHFQKTALVVEAADALTVGKRNQNKQAHQFRRKVVKVGIDPHFSYANMLCDVAWARAYGTTGFFIPESKPMVNTQAGKGEQWAGLPEDVVSMMRQPAPPGTCGACANFDAEHSRCRERSFSVEARDPGCPVYVPKD